MNPLRVGVLGPLIAHWDDREINLGPARQRALFAVLASRANKVVTRKELIAAVWGDNPPATAAGNVYTYVSGLRRVLGPDREAAAEILTSGPAGYMLRLDPANLDSERMAQLGAEALACEQAGDLTGADERLVAARRVFRSTPYSGLTGDYFEVERAHLQRMALNLVAQRVRVLSALGDDGLIAELSRIVHDYPLQEPLHEMLIQALSRAGRAAEALEAYQNARRIIVSELGVEPGSGLRDLQRRLLTGALETPAPVPVAASLVPVLPTQVARALRDGFGTGPFVGRDAEVTELQSRITAAERGTGAAVWIEGEPGIGKTELLMRAFSGGADAGRLPWSARLSWGVADELDRYVPLQVVTRALGLEPDSSDPRRAALAGELHAASTMDGDDAGPAIAAERIIAYLRGACASTPLILVVDDLHWADDATLLLWERLVALTRQLPLLLVAAARPEPQGRELERLRAAVQNHQGLVLHVEPLDDGATGELVASVVGAPVGPHLHGVVTSSGGNPLCAREMTSGLLRRGAVTFNPEGYADIAPSDLVEVPPSLVAVIRGTLDFLSDDTQEVLRLAALLGAEFAVDDMVAVTGRTPFGLMGNLEEALAAGILVDAGTDLAFRHPFLRQGLYDSISPAERPHLHRQTAEVLARGGSPVTRVAEQLAAEITVVDEWVVGWLTDNHAELVKRAPQLASTLLRTALDSGVASPRQRETLLVSLVKLDFRYDQYPVFEAREALGVATDPADRAEMRQLLAAMRFRQGHVDEAIELLTPAVDDGSVPEIWRTRHRVLLANFRRGSLDDLDQADRTAERVRAEAEAAGQYYEAAFALQTTWLTNSIRRDHERALSYVDRALDVVRDHPTVAGMYFDLLDNRMFTLQNLDRLDEAERTLREAALFAIRHRLPATLQVASAVQYYWLGRWDDATAEVSAVPEDAPGVTFLGLREPGAVTMLLHGVAALIAGHREETGLATAHLDAANALPVTDAERESCDFLLVARSLVAEQQDRAGEALDELSPLLIPAYAPMMLRHQWLPDAVRLALGLGRTEIAEQAAEICAREAAKEKRPARAFTAAARCRALLDNDPGPALAAAAHYREVGRVPELGAALEDAAVLLAARRRPHEAARTGAEAAEIYRVLGARWDLRRTRARLAEYGVTPDRGSSVSRT